MIEVRGDLWTYPADFRVITTNGSIKRDGSAVMGRGCAREAMQRYHLLPRVLGRELKLNGNHLFWFEKLNLLTFPVKDQWMETARASLIEQSVQELIDFIALQPPLRTYVMPRPGCGNGHLDWQQVRPLLTCLPNNVAVITFPGGLT